LKGKAMQQDKNQILFREYDNREIVQGECHHTFPAHIHESLCIGLITSGQAVCSINGCKEVLSAGDFYVVPPRTLHTLAPAEHKKYSYTVICFKGLPSREGCDDYVSCAKAYIENTRSKFTINALSKAMHVSKFHLSRVFRGQIGATPYQFYNKVRIKKIRQGLQAGLSPSDMAFDLNFCDQSHLCNTFKRHVGITPAQYINSYHCD
jgi:AraC-like DNA-binding protein